MRAVLGLLTLAAAAAKSLSRVRLCATQWTTAYQAPPSMGFFQARVLEWGAIALSVTLASTDESSEEECTQAGRDAGILFSPAGCATCARLR